MCDKQEQEIHSVIVLISRHIEKKHTQQNDENVQNYTWRLLFNQGVTVMQTFSVMGIF